MTAPIGIEIVPPEGEVGTPTVTCSRGYSERDHYADLCGCGEYCSCGSGYLAVECVACIADESYDDESDYDGEGLIHDYSWKPSPIFHGDGPVYLGMELEIDYSGYSIGSLAQLATAHLNDLAYLKSDSSVTGFEIVTHPMSYDYAIEHFPWGMLPDLRANGATTGRDTGIHIHVGREGFSGRSHQYRWMKFFYRNREAIVSVAHRDSGEWAAFTTEGREGVYRHVKRGTSGPRYQAINTQNAATLEVRVFASSLAKSRVKAYLALIDATVEYTRTLNARMVATRDGWKWASFVEWLKGRSKYQPLYSYADRAAEPHVAEAAEIRNSAELADIKFAAERREADLRIARAREQENLNSVNARRRRLLNNREAMLEAMGYYEEMTRDSATGTYGGNGIFLHYLSGANYQNDHGCSCHECVRGAYVRHFNLTI